MQDTQSNQPEPIDFARFNLTRDEFDQLKELGIVRNGVGIYNVKRGVFLTNDDFEIVIFSFRRGRLKLKEAEDKLKIKQKGVLEKSLEQTTLGKLLNLKTSDLELSLKQTTVGKMFDVDAAKIKQALGSTVPGKIYNLFSSDEASSVYSDTPTTQSVTPTPSDPEQSETPSSARTYSRDEIEFLKSIGLAPRGNGIVNEKTGRFVNLKAVDEIVSYYSQGISSISEMQNSVLQELEALTEELPEEETTKVVGKESATGDTQVRGRQGLNVLGFFNAYKAQQDEQLRVSIQIDTKIVTLGELILASLAAKDTQKSKEMARRLTNLKPVAAAAISAAMLMLYPIVAGVMNLVESIKSYIKKLPGTEGGKVGEKPRKNIFGFEIPATEEGYAPVVEPATGEFERLTFKQLSEKQKEAFIRGQARAEGFFRDGDRATIGQRLNNPGNIVYAGPNSVQALKFGAAPGETIKGPDGITRTFARFPSVELGLAAQRELMERKYGGVPIEQALRTYVQPSPTPRGEAEFASYKRTIQKEIASVAPIKSPGEPVIASAESPAVNVPPSTKSVPVAPKAQSGERVSQATRAADIRPTRLAAAPSAGGGSVSLPGPGRVPTGASGTSTVEEGSADPSLSYKLYYGVA